MAAMSGNLKAVQKLVAAGARQGVPDEVNAQFYKHKFEMSKDSRVARWVLMRQIVTSRSDQFFLSTPVHAWHAKIAFKTASKE